MHSDNLQNWILWRDKLFCDFWLFFYNLDCTKCKFPDFSQNSFFPWPSTKFPDFSLTFARSGISLTFPWPLDTLVRIYLHFLSFLNIWDGTGVWNSSSWMTITSLSIAAGALTMKDPGGWINIKMASYQYRKSHCGDKTILRPSYLHNGISYTGKTTSLYWIGALNISSHGIDLILLEFPISAPKGLTQDIEMK